MPKKAPSLDFQIWNSITIEMKKCKVLNGLNILSLDLLGFFHQKTPRTLQTLEPN